MWLSKSFKNNSSFKIITLHTNIDNHMKINLSLIYKRDHTCLNKWCISGIYNKELQKGWHTHTHTWSSFVSPSRLFTAAAAAAAAAAVAMWCEMWGGNATTCPPGVCGGIPGGNAPVGNGGMWLPGWKAFWFIWAQKGKSYKQRLGKHIQENLIP